MTGIQIKIINNSENEIPVYATAGSSGMDIRAHLTEPVILKPLEKETDPNRIIH